MGFSVYSWDQYEKAMGLKRQGVGSQRIAKILGLKTRNAIEDWINKGRKPYYYSEARIKACNSKENIERMKKMNAITQPRATKMAAQLKTKRLPDYAKVLSEDLAYILGVVYGDGHVSIDQRRIMLGVTDYDFADFFRKTLEKWSGFRVRFITRKPTFSKSCIGKKLQWLVYIDSKEASEFVANFDLNKLIAAEVKIKSAFLRGFFDSEGCVNARGSLSAYNSDYELIKFVETLLNAIGIETTFRSYYGYSVDKKIKSLRYMIYVRAKSRQRFKNLVGFNLGRRQIRLVQSCSHMRKQGLQEVQKMRENREGFEPKHRERLADHVVFIGNKPFNRI